MIHKTLLILLIACTGCVELDVNLRSTSSRKDETVSPSAIATPITADQVTPANARRMCDALWAEMEREELKR